MDFSAPDVLIGILLVNAAICAAYGIRSFRRRRAVATAMHRAIRDLPQPSRSRPPRQDTRASQGAVVPRDRSAVDVALDDPAGSGVLEEQLGRHREIEELMLASTYRLSPDRLARARVPEPASDSE